MGLYESDEALKKSQESGSNRTRMEKGRMDRDSNRKRHTNGFELLAIFNL